MVATAKRDTVIEDVEVVDLGIDTSTFSHEGAIGFDKVRTMLRGRGKGPVSLETLRRWANEREGYRPAGKSGPRLVLPTIRLSGLYFSMPEWIEAFDQARIRLGRRPTQAPEEVSRTPAKRSAHQRQAEKHCRKVGIAK